MDSWWKTPWQFLLCVGWEGQGFEHRLARKEVKDGEGGGVLRVPDLAEGGPLFLIPPSAPPADPLRLTGGFLLSFQEAGGRWWGERVLEAVLRASSLERACQFIKAFGERGGNLHVT